MLIDIRATLEAGKWDNLAGGHKDLCQFFLPWGKTLHPEMGPSGLCGGSELSDISDGNKV